MKILSVSSRLEASRIYLMEQVGGGAESSASSTHHKHLHGAAVHAVGKVYLVTSSRRIPFSSLTFMTAKRAEDQRGSKGIKGDQVVSD